MVKRELSQKGEAHNLLVDLRSDPLSDFVQKDKILEQTYVRNYTKLNIVKLVVIGGRQKVFEGHKPSICDRLWVYDIWFSNKHIPEKAEQDSISGFEIMDM